ncbi:MAG: anion permease [Flavobacteriales bacterium]|nr:MAG: anion permease [Flavobacteriales bacterium]
MRALLFRLAGPVCAVLLYLAFQHLGHMPAAMAGAVLWMAIWWISEAVPLAVTSLLPLVLFPLCGIASTAATAMHYGKEIIFLFLGGFLLALGIERSGLHRRAALWIMVRAGTAPSRLLLGVMLSSALLSMWINSTACVLVMLPIALGLVDKSKHVEGNNLAFALLLGAAYGATIGGMATPVGTPPNLIFMEVAEQLFPQQDAVGFGAWMAFGGPIMCIYLAFAWLLLHLLFTRGIGFVPNTAHTVREELRALGRPTRDERLAAACFCSAAVLWITAGRIEFSEGVVYPGWQREGTWLEGFSDAAVAIACSIPLFLIPRKNSEESGDRMLLGWDFVQQRVPWGVLLLIGGGLAMASGFEASGLANIMGQAMAGWNTGSDVAQVGLIALTTTGLSELGSNSAIAGLVLPLLGSAAPAWGMEPFTAMIPGTLAATCGFMLPISSPMMAIVFATGRVPVRTMLRAGVWMDLAGIVLLALWFGL